MNRAAVRQVERVDLNTLGSGAAGPRQTRWGQRVPPCGSDTLRLPSEGGAK